MEIDVTSHTLLPAASAGIAASGGIFVGRDAVLTRLSATLGEAHAGGARLILIEGPAGMGKTSLIHQFARITQTPQILYASCEETETGLAFGVIEQLADQACELTAAETRSGRLADPAAVGRTFLDLLENVREFGPAVILIDDIQWADVPSLHALIFAFRRLRADQVLVVVTARDIADPRLPDGLRHLLTGPAGSRVRLAGLEASEVRTLCWNAGRLKITPRAAARLRDHTDGNPLFVRALMEELPAATIRDTGLPLPAPHSFARAVIRKLTACPAGTNQMAAAVASLGESCPIPLAARLSGLEDPLGALDEAVRAGLLEEPRPGIVGFPHPLIRATIYGHLGPGQRTSLHARAATLVDDSTTALRHRIAACKGPDAALAAQAAEFAHAQARRGRWFAAAQELRAAARIQPDRAERDRCVLEAADFLLQAGEVAEVFALREELEACTDDLRRQYLLGYLAAAAGQLEEGSRHLTSAWARCDRQKEPVLAARIAAAMARVASLTAPGRPAVHWACQALRTDRAAGHAASALNVLLLGLGQAGHPQLGLKLAARHHAGGRGALDGLCGHGALCLWTDDLDGAIRQFTAAARTYLRLGPADFAVTSCVGLAEAYWRLGAWDDAISYGELAVSLADESEHRWLVPLAHARAAYPYIGRGQWEKAAEHLRAGRSSHALTANYPAVWLRDVEGFLAFAQNEPVKAVTALEPLQIVTGDGRDRLGNQPGVLEWRDTYAEALTVLGRPDAAERILRPLEQQAARHQRLSAVVAAARARGSLEFSRGQRQAADLAFRKGLACAGELNRPFSVARLELAYGCFLRRVGRRGAAVTQLEAAHGRFRSLKALPWLGESERELAACGRARAIGPRSGGGKLTSQELAVGRLAAEGLANQQIARRLVLSVKTIEYHLGKIYAKVGVRSRTQLARWLAQN